uniref:Uncharacterized protein n=1 Tax=Timema cristinae TaxID=61476 RepID=A0A7R9CF92_TIMCR|nr:unnamed protein product [Timema cristinae]
MLSSTAEDGEIEVRISVGSAPSKEEKAMLAIAGGGQRVKGREGLVLLCQALTVARLTAYRLMIRGEEKLNLEFDRYIPMSNGLRTQLYSAVDIDVEDSPEHFSDIAGLQEELIEVQSDVNVAPKVDESMSNTLNFLEKEVYTSKAVTPKKVTELVKEVQYSTSPEYIELTSPTKLTKMELVAIMRSLTNWRKEFKPPFQQLTCLERKDEEKRAIVTRASWRSFEVQVNGQVIHSKLSTMAFPDFTNVIDIVGDAAQGKEVKSVSVQQPITDCDIM